MASAKHNTGGLQDFLDSLYEDETLIQPVFPARIVGSFDRFVPTQEDELALGGLRQRTQQLDVLGLGILDVLVVHVVSFFGIELRTVGAGEFVTIVAIVVVTGRD